MNKEPYPCPFCNEQPKITEHFKHDDLFSLVHRCPYVGVITIDWRGLEQIMDAWDTRNGVPRYDG